MGAQGLGTGGHAHGDSTYTVVGILQPSVSVLDRLLCEAVWLGLLAAGLGLLLGQGFAAALAWFLQLDNSLLIGGMVWPAALVVVPCLALGVSVGAALLPALGAYRVSVLELLQSR